MTAGRIFSLRKGMSSTMSKRSILHFITTNSRCSPSIMKVTSRAWILEPRLSWLRAARRSLVLEQCITASEPAYIAKHAFQLAQEFNNFYHKHHILTEEDPARKTFLLATAAVALRELIEVLRCLGIESPEAM